MSTKSTYPQSAQQARHPINVLGQFFKYFPRTIINAAAAGCGIEAKARTYSARWSASSVCGLFSSRYP